jgi:ABC-2 type transport system permease protein
MNVPTLLFAETRRQFTLMRRYPLNTISMVIMLWMFFLGLVFGSRAIAGAAGPANPTTMGASLVSYLIWVYALTAIMGISGDVAMESQTGTLEQVYLSPYGVPVVFITRQVAGLVLTTVQIVLVAVLTVLATKAQVAWKLDQMLPILVIMMFSLYGVGLILGGLALIFKQIGNLLMILQFVLLFVAFAPTETLKGPARLFAAIFPLSQGTGLLRAIAKGEGTFLTLWRESQVQYLIACSIVYLVVGLVVYRWLDGQARRRGTIGQY